MKLGCWIQLITVQVPFLVDIRGPGEILYNFWTDRLAVLPGKMLLGFLDKPCDVTWKKSRFLNTCFVFKSEDSLIKMYHGL